MPNNRPNPREIPDAAKATLLEHIKTTIGKITPAINDLQANGADGPSSPDRQGLNHVMFGVGRPSPDTYKKFERLGSNRAQKIREIIGDSIVVCQIQMALLPDKRMHEALAEVYAEKSVGSVMFDYVIATSRFKYKDGGGDGLVWDYLIHVLKAGKNATPEEKRIAGVGIMRIKEALSDAAQHPDWQHAKRGMQDVIKKTYDPELVQDRLLLLCKTEFYKNLAEGKPKTQLTIFNELMLESRQEIEALRHVYARRGFSAPVVDNALKEDIQDVMLPTREELQRITDEETPLVYSRKKLAGHILSSALLGLCVGHILVDSNDDWGGRTFAPFGSLVLLGITLNFIAGYATERQFPKSNDETSRHAAASVYEKLRGIQKAHRNIVVAQRKALQPVCHSDDEKTPEERSADRTPVLSEAAMADTDMTREQRRKAWSEIGLIKPKTRPAQAVPAPQPEREEVQPALPTFHFITKEGDTQELTLYPVQGRGHMYCAMYRKKGVGVDIETHKAIKEIITTGQTASDHDAQGLTYERSSQLWKVKLLGNKGKGDIRVPVDKLERQTLEVNGAKQLVTILVARVDHITNHKGMDSIRSNGASRG